jgi:cell division protein FtsB
MPPTTHNPTIDAALYSLVGLALLFLGYRIGRWVGAMTASKLVASKEQELFTTQRGFKSLYDQELAKLKEDNGTLTEKVKSLETRVEDYRKKAAGFGGLFGGAGKKADAMYALLLENESLEEALFTQNEKLKQERTDALKESMRSVGYRRVLMSQLLTDDRIKGVVAEIIGDDRRLPQPQQGGAANSQSGSPQVTGTAE